MTNSLNLKPTFRLASGYSGDPTAIASAASAAAEIARAFARCPLPQPARAYASEELSGAKLRHPPSAALLLALASHGYTPTELGSLLDISPARAISILSSEDALTDAADAADAAWFERELSAGTYTGEGAHIVHADLARQRAETAAAWCFEEDIVG